MGLCLDVDKLDFEKSYDLEKMLKRPNQKDKFSIWIILEAIQDPMNLGAILRTSYYFGVDEIFTPKEKSCKLSPVVSKASSGIMEVLPVNQIEDLTSFLQKCKKHEWRILGTSLPTKENNTSFQNLKLDSNTILILGNEGTGLSEEVKNLVDNTITIESGQQDDCLDSLNVSVSTGILLFQLSKKLIK